MNAHSIIVCALLATSASAAAEPVIFHRSRFPDMTTVELSLVFGPVSTANGYDFNVTIGVTEIRQGDRPGFRDRAAHKALVRCGAPAAISVGGVDYPIGGLARPLETDNWKVDLWRAVCAVPTS